MTSINESGQGVGKPPGSRDSDIELSSTKKSIHGPGKPPKNVIQKTAAVAVGTITGQQAQSLGAVPKSKELGQLQKKETDVRRGISEISLQILNNKEELKNEQKNLMDAITKIKDSLPSGNIMENVELAESFFKQGELNEGLLYIPEEIPQDALQTICGKIETLFKSTKNLEKELQLKKNELKLVKEQQTQIYK